LTSRIFTAAVAALTLLGAAASSVSALAQPPGPTGGNHSHGSTGGGGTHTAAVGGHGGGGSYRGHGGGGNGIGAFGAGIVLGAVLGNYAGHPYYCRGHHHWRWSNRRQEYVYDYRSSC
jgi:hypothetical protein